MASQALLQESMPGAFGTFQAHGELGHNQAAEYNLSPCQLLGCSKQDGIDGHHFLIESYHLHAMCTLAGISRLSFTGRFPAPLSTFLVFINNLLSDVPCS